MRRICYLKGIKKQLLYNDLIYNALDFDNFSTMTSSADEKCYFGNVENVIVSG